MPHTTRRSPWNCAHGAYGDQPWACSGCCALAGLFGLAAQPFPPGLPRRTFYFEEAVRLWGEAAGNSMPRMAIDLWLAHNAGVPWAEWKAQRDADRAPGSSRREAAGWSLSGWARR